MPISILIADDHLIARLGMRALLQNLPGIDVVGEAQDGLEARCLAHTLKPDVILMDFAMPVLNGAEAAACIRAELPHAHTLGLLESVNRSQIAEMMRACACGCVFKNECSYQELNAALSSAASGRPYLNPNALRSILEDRVEQSAPLPLTPAPRSSDRAIRQEDKQVLTYLADGVSIQEIALRLKVCAKTITRRRDRLMQHLEISSIAQLTKFAIRLGLTSLD
jgi:DNA-binding NarL/FixJ family response regulator